MQATGNLQRNFVVADNLGLVHSCAHKFTGRGIEYDDLFQAGCIGIIKAAEAFDPCRGIKFSTYAVPVILGEIKRLFRDGGTVKISRSIKELSGKINRTRETFALKNDREPTISELAELLSVSSEDIAEAVSACSPVISLTSDEESGNGQLDIPVPSPEDELSDSISLRQSLALLSENDRLLITLRYFGGKTQSQTAKQLGMTQVQVSRKEKKLLEQLKNDLLPAR